MLSVRRKWPRSKLGLCDMRASPSVTLNRPPRSLIWLTVEVNTGAAVPPRMIRTAGPTHARTHAHLAAAEERHVIGRPVAPPFRYSEPTEAARGPFGRASRIPRTAAGTRRSTRRRGIPCRRAAPGAIRRLSSRLIVSSAASRRHGSPNRSSILVCCPRRRMGTDPAGPICA
jgi:hypothetical protein